MPTLVHSQTKASELQAGGFSLPMLQVSPYYDIGSGGLVKNKMLNVFIAGFAPSSNQLGITGIVEDTTGPYTGAFNIPLPTTSGDTVASILAMVTPAINGFYMTNLGVNPDSISWVGTSVAGNRSFSNPSLAVNTSRQASTVQDALVIASVEIDATLSLTSGAKGTVTLKYADDSAFTTNIVIASLSTNGNTGALSLGINTVGAGAGPVTGIVPAGKYYRLVTTNVTGTPTYGTPVIQEVLL